MSGFIGDETEDPYVFIQWKGTDVCMDFHCECGAHCHFDGYFAYEVRCPHCKTIWEMPCYAKPRRIATERYEGSAKDMEPDEDYADEVLGADGITRLVAKPIPQE